jgi:hypothetical protein
VLRILAVVAAVVLVIALVIGRTHDRAPARAAPMQPAPVPTTIAGTAAAPPPSPIKKITPDERRELQRKIDDARAARGHAATSAGERPHLPAAKGGLESLPPGTVDMVKQALPYLAACYGHGATVTGPRSALVLVSLHGDPDVGTLIDPGEMHDDTGAPTDPEVASCLASTLQSLQLPPMATGDTVDVQFTFRY